MDNPNNNQNNGNKGPQGNSMLLIFSIAVIIALVGWYAMSRLVSDAATESITYNEFMDMIEKGIVDEVVISDTQITITTKPGSEKYSSDKTYYTGTVDNPELFKILQNAGVTYKGMHPTSNPMLEMVITVGGSLLLMYLLMTLLMRRMGGGGGVMGVGKSNAKVYVQKETGVTFKDVAGEDEAKESLTEIVDFLHNPAKYTKIGARLPKGALLVGPPGTGKTLLAKAVAGEAEVPFFSLTGSDFVEMFVGVGASRVRDLFKQAQQSAPCIIFIDEIDAIGKSRDSRYGGGNDEREQTLNQLLSEMDGFDSSKGLLVLAATNRPEILDPALLRPGRFDRRIIVDKPDLKGRIEILKVHSKDVLMDETVDLEAIALATSGAVGSDLANMINEAAINAVKSGRKVVTQEDLFESVEVVLAGKEKKDRLMNNKEKCTVAYHEVGHALAAALQKEAEPVQKITIVPRTMGSLGYVMTVPEEERYLMTEAELRCELVTMLAGRAAEELVFDSVTTGAANDIEKATRISRAMITQYGMSKKFGLIGLESVESRYLDGRAVLNCGEQTASEIDAEVMKMLKESYEKAKELLSGSRDALDQIASFLIEKETITGKQFMEIFNRVRVEHGQKAIPVSDESLERAKKSSHEPSAESYVGHGSQEPSADGHVGHGSQEPSADGHMGYDSQEPSADGHMGYGSQEPSTDGHVGYDSLVDWEPKDGIE